SLGDELAPAGPCQPRGQTLTVLLHAACERPECLGVDPKSLESVVRGTARGQRPLRTFGKRFQAVELGATDSAFLFAKGHLGDSKGVVLLVTQCAGDLGVGEALAAQ